MKEKAGSTKSIRAAVVGEELAAFPRHAPSVAGVSTSRFLSRPTH